MGSVSEADADSQQGGGRVSGVFFKAVVQSVLLFGAKTWVVTPRMGRVLGGSRTMRCNG